MTADWEAEGLLEGLDQRGRAARRELLEELSEHFSLEELREAVHEGRLALLPVERALAGGSGGHTVAEVAESSGVDADVLLRQRRALGLPVVDPEQPEGSQDDMEAAQRMRVLLDAGLPEDGILEVTRVVGMTMSQLAAACRGLIRESLVRPEDTELDVAHRFTAAAEELKPVLGEILEHTLGLHLREQLRHDIIGSGSPDGDGSGSELTACFADLVGFTRLGERLPVEELGALSGRLNELASQASSGPVRLVKLIGDAAMLVSPETDALLESALDLVAAADEQGEDFPQLRAGASRGRAISRGGDWYGPPVNTASRITGVAYPGSVLVSQAVRDAAEGEYRWSFAGERKLKGIKGGVKLFRVRRPESGDGAGDGDGD